MLAFLCCEILKAVKDYGFRHRHFSGITPHTAHTLLDANSHGAGAKTTNPMTSEGQRENFTPSTYVLFMLGFLEQSLIFDIYTTENNMGEYGNMGEVNSWFSFMRKHFPTGSSKVGMLSRSASQKKKGIYLMLSSLIISLDVHMRRPAVLIHWTQLGLLEQTVAFNMLIGEFASAGQRVFPGT